MSVTTKSVAYTGALLIFVFHVVFFLSWGCRLRKCAKGKDTVVFCFISDTSKSLLIV